ncbi:MAG: hypothetical protein WBQ60_12945 [Asticcacaulis sp.]
MKIALPLLVLSISLCGCDRLQDLWRKPEMGPTYAVAVPSLAEGDIRLYPPLKDAKTTAPSLQVRNGECQTGACVVWDKKRWKPLLKTEAADMAYLSVIMPTGSDYSPELWRPVGASGQNILVSAAGQDGIARGLFDGLRIGLSNAGTTTYFTAYSVESAATLRANGLCTRDMTVDAGHPAKSGCLQKIADDRYVLPVDGEVVIAGDKAWLLQRRPDRSANLIDLLALPKGPVVCLPGLIIDTQGRWMGPPDSALSPNLFVSRARPTPAYEAHKASLMKACPATGA